MRLLTKIALTTAFAIGLAGAAQAQEYQHIQAGAGPIASAVVGPPGFTTYYISGALPTPTTPAADGKPAVYGDTTAQTRSVLDNLKAQLTKLGLTFGDVAMAHVFMTPEVDFAAMNKVWLTEFGTAAQPNKPARAAFKVVAMAAPGALLEIEFIAVKK